MVVKAVTCPHHSTRVRVRGREQHFTESGDAMLTVSASEMAACCR